ncbi:urea carboxylase [Eremomyces bilateralis CBS 781.70]|uniref:Urea carboxylase n=1 Tax=Eremomyces bilateralis CBS 781.70 TaxID=1392243 RepID=A0A6G1FWF0_9PEZI|nr:urea carboxylase [Eremomyces bilateralis CBS 781.70]KAF1810058.1 urea carboxylase [Eremomyces bilateralis CBS 781.70]
MVFVGPSSDSILEMGLKHRAREIAIQAKVPVVPGTDLLESEDEVLAAAERLGYPVMLKATGGGGGMGLQVCKSTEDVSAAFAMVRSRGEKLFKNSGLFLEKYYLNSRHIEVQVFGNGTETVHFGERECSIQRRHQKVIEECPSPFVAAHPELRQQLTECATRYAMRLNYKSAGTVEFLVDDESGGFFFLEMNTRLQVEHGITELCYDVDLVALMLRQADMEKLGAGGIPSSELRSLQKPGPTSAAIEARIYAEDPYRGFAPSPGIFQEVHWPEQEGVRIDTWVQSGQDVSLHYDPLLAKVMVHAPTREQAIEKMGDICSEGIALKGPTTNLDFLRKVMASDAFDKGDTLTNFLDTRFAYEPCGIDIISPGAYSTIQDFPARASIGHGVPKSGPMDNITARIANLLVHNAPGTEVIEMTLFGAELLFTSAAVVSVCGASALVTVDGSERPMWSTLVVKAGQTLKIGTVSGVGCRMYLAVRGGFPNIPLFCGSRSTTPSLKFGGTQGRTIRKGDFLQLTDLTSTWAAETHEYTLPSAMIPPMEVKEVYVLQGPHDSDDIMTMADKDMLYNTEWKVGHNSNRTGVRIIGPAPEWARKDGGEAGSHPSNYLDYGYPSPGGVNWGGDSGCIFSVDSPNFGGLICSTTVISAEMWKLGQLKPDTSFRMIPVSLEDAVQQIRRVDLCLSAIADEIDGKLAAAVQPVWSLGRSDIIPYGAVLQTVQASSENPLRPKVVYRQAGDRFLLIEFGEQRTDIAVVALIRLLMEKLESLADLTLLLTPHVGSVTIEYDPFQISQSKLLSRIHEIESNILATIDITIPCREIRLPLVMDHPDVQECIQRYMDTVRNKAAYLPDNIEYLRKCNGLQSRREVFEKMLHTEYVVVAVGFLCGAPMLFPLNPTFLQCQKYNPTRVSTPGGTLGLGGSIVAAYPIEQPGGYMIVARSLELWDPFGTKPGFTSERPWMFEPFDKIKFYEVSVEEYDLLALDFSAGRYQWQVSESSFNVREAYDTFQKAKSDASVLEYKRRQQEGLKEQEQIERGLYSTWKAEIESEEKAELGGESTVDLNDTNSVSSPMAANVWKVEVKPGDELKEGQLISILEAMKMEVNIYAQKSLAGLKVDAILKKPGSIVGAGDVILSAK